MLTPTVIATVFCDDVRREMTNKDILIGVYGGDIVVPSFPASLNGAYWIEIFNSEKGKFQSEVRIGISEKAPFRIRMEIEAEKSGTMSVLIPQFQFQVEKPCELTLEMLIDGSWQLLKTKNILQGQGNHPVIFSSDPPPHA